MSNGLAVRLSPSDGGGQYGPAVEFTSARPRLLHLVPSFYTPRVAQISPRSAPPNTEAPVRALDALWMCQECDQRPAAVAGCYCLECVRDYRQCLQCGVHESMHHRENRLRRRTAIMRTTYVCLACAHHQVCWNRGVGPDAHAASMPVDMQQQPSQPSAGMSS